jgi:hypothetical protein
VIGSVRAITAARPAAGRVGGQRVLLVWAVWAVWVVWVGCVGVVVWVGCVGVGVWVGERSGGWGVGGLGGWGVGWVYSLLGDNSSDVCKSSQQR